MCKRYHKEFFIFASVHDKQCEPENDHNIAKTCVHEFSSDSYIAIAIVINNTVSVH